jgi:GUCT (NUC152) domain
VHKTAGIDGKIGKIAVAKDARYAVFDMAKDVAAALISFSQTQDLKAIEFGVCHTLPEMSPQVNFSLMHFKLLHLQIIQLSFQQVVPHDALHNPLCVTSIVIYTHCVLI